jgi:hypothetical protein
MLLRNPKVDLHGHESIIIQFTEQAQSLKIIRFRLLRKRVLQLFKTFFSLDGAQQIITVFNISCNSFLLPTWIIHPMLSKSIEVIH